MIRLGFIGCGNIARKGHIEPTLRHLEDVELVAFYDVRTLAAEECAALYGGAVCRSLRELVEMGLDAAYICIPPDAHGPAERALIQARIPFFVEKPVHLDLQEAIELAHRIEDQGLITAVGYHFRYLPLTQRVREALQGRQVVLTHAFWLQGTPALEFNLSFRRSGGQVVEQVTHWLDLLRYTVGEVVEVSARYDCLAHEWGPEWENNDVGAAWLRFENGALGTLLNGYALRHTLGKQGIELYCTDARFEWFPAAKRCLAYLGQEREEWVDETKVLHQPEDLAFIEAIRIQNPAPILCDYWEGVRTLALSLALNEAADTGESVSVWRE